MGAARGHLGHGGQQGAHVRPMSGKAPSEMRPARVVEEGERQVGREDGVADLGGIRGQGHREGPSHFRSEGPWGLLPGRLQAAHRGQSLGADNEPEVEVSTQHVRGDVGRKHQRHRSANPRIAAASR